MALNFVGDTLKMIKHKTWATVIVAIKSMGSMTKKGLGQMMPTSRMSSPAPQVGENSQSNVPDIVSYPVL